MSNSFDFDIMISVKNGQALSRLSVFDALGARNAEQMRTVAKLCKSLKINMTNFRSFRHVLTNKFRKSIIIIMKNG